MAHICKILYKLYLYLVWQQPTSVMGKTRPGSDKKHVYVQRIFLLALGFKLLFTAPLGQSQN